jgi:hypothetical protein
MNTQQSFLHRARQGDPQAIAALLQQSFNDSAVTINARLEAGQLRILVESTQVPDQDRSLQLMHSLLSQLTVSSIKTVLVYGRTLGEALPDWEWSRSLPVSQHAVSPIPSAIAPLNPPQANSKADVSAQTSRNRQSQFMFTGMVAIAALIAVNLFLGFRSIFTLRGESQAYANEAIPTILASWNTRALVDRASPEYLQDLPRSDIEQVFGRLSQDLGKLRRYQGATCNVRSSLTLGGKIVSDCHADLVFEKSSAVVKVELIQQGEQWQIDDFRIQANASTYLPED